jgi:hypothetical protein
LTDFFRTDVNDRSFIRGAARLLYAAEDVSAPTQISDIISLTSGTLYDAQADWTDLGATKTGIQISVNNTEEAFDIDQVLGDIQAQVGAARLAARRTSELLTEAGMDDLVTVPTFE